MKSISICLFALAAGTACLAQDWELGVSGGVGVYTKSTIKAEAGDVNAGFKTGPAFSAFLTQNLYNHISGQIRYTFQFNELQAKSGGTEATFTGQSHAVHYDLMFLAGDPDAPVRPYVLAGGGMKIYRGTGKEQETQELIDIVALTRTQQVKPLVTFGGGIKAKVGQRGFVYAEVRDYLTPFPENVIAPVPPAKVSGWVHDFVPMIGLSFSF